MDVVAGMPGSVLPQLTGFLPTTGHHGPDPATVPIPAVETTWLSADRIAEARRVWSQAYGRIISTEEATEILMNVRRLAETLLRSTEEQHSHEDRRMG